MEWLQGELYELTSRPLSTLFTFALMFACISLARAWLDVDVKLFSEWDWLTKSKKHKKKEG